MGSVNTRCLLAAPRSVSLPCTRACTHTCTNTRWHRCHRGESENERPRRGGGEGGEKPMWQREILIFSESADPPPRCSLHRSLLVTHHTNLSSASFFLLPPLSLFEQSLFCFSHHLPILSSSCPPTPSFFAPPSLGFHCFVLSLFLYSTSLILSHSGRAAGRQKQHTLMLLYLTRHTHSCAPCTTAQT